MYMNTIIFYSKLLGVKSPWSIREVILDDAGERVDVYMEHCSGVRFPCPVCEEFCGVYDHTTEREFRHLNTCQMETWLHVRIPRINCPTHGVQQIIHGIAEDTTGLTFAFESLALMLEHECSLESTSRLLGLDWHTCHRIQEKAVSRGMARKPKAIPARIGVDEKSFAKGHKYETLVYNLDHGIVEYVCDHRGQESLESYYSRFNKEELASVEVITMDMWDPYIAATKAYVPKAEKKIVFDRYHVIKQVVDAVDKVRKQENKALQEQGNGLLKGTRYLWLWNQENLPEWRKEEFKELQAQDLKVCRAWAIKENIRHLWDYRTEGWMRKYFKKWYHWATHSRLQPIIKAARTLKRHLDNILTYAKHHITNALGESLNSKIEKVKRLACGYRNREHYKTAIYFHCGGLDLMPRRPDISMQVMTA